MSADDGRWSVRFPGLFSDQYADYADARLRFTTAAVPADQVSRLHLVAVTPASDVIICRSEAGWRFLPGGTRETGESLGDLARRELMEEAGAQLTSPPRYFAAHIADSQGPAPYRPHLPHPRAYWAYAVARARLIAPPANPPDGEQVIEVRTMASEPAADYIAEHDPMLADVLRLADAMGLIRHGA
jgi:8-oxo-dGTP diphosphatase